ncbi:hypothetical protein B0H14DRAFT_2646945 [Mycena olivaceomarginata]|nr:hypothetical protein B0H14DRAFT_2646945 [Mycena olivaceomarginata]
MSNVKCDMSHFSPRLQVHVALEAFGSHWYERSASNVYKVMKKKIGIAAVVSKLTRTSRSRPPTAPFDHKNVLHGPRSEGAPLRSMYIDDQAEEDTDAEMEDSEADYDDEDSMEARVRRDEESTFVRANLAQAQEQWLKGGPRPRVPTPPPFRWLEDRASPTPPGQDMEVEQEGETLAGSPNSMDEESGSETETEDARIRRYFDEQAEDSDEDAGEEREEEEQEMEEDRATKTPREVEKWVAHFQNEDKIAHYKRDVAREAAGEAGAPSAEQKRMLSPRELVLYNKAKNLRTNMQIAEFERALHWEMLADVDVEPHTWVRAPTSSTAARRGKARCNANAQYVAEMVSQSGAFLRGNRAVRGNHAEWIIASRARKAVSRSRRWGSRCGDDGGSEGFYRQNNVLPPAPKPYPKGKGPIAPVKPPKPFEVGLAQLKRHALDLYYHFRIHDRVRVVSGALYVGAIGRVEEVEGDFLTVAIPKDWEVWGDLAEPHLRCYQTFHYQHCPRYSSVGHRRLRSRYERAVRGASRCDSGAPQFRLPGVTRDMRMCPIHAKFAARTWTSSTNFGLPRQQMSALCQLERKQLR